MNSLSRPSRDGVARGRRDGSGFGGKILCLEVLEVVCPIRRVHSANPVSNPLSRPSDAKWQRLGATREHETALCAVHENPLARDTKSVQAARRNTKALRPVLEEKEQAVRSKEKVVRSKCGRFVFCCGARRTQQDVDHHTYSLLPTPYSLLPTPSLLWCAKRVCVLCGKSQRGDRRRRGESGSRMRGQPKKNSALNSHFAKGRWERIEGREACEAFSCLDMRRWRVSCRPQGAFVAGGARRRRLSWSRPPAARLWRFGGMRRRAG